MSDERVTQLERIIVETVDALKSPVGSETVRTKGSELPGLARRLRSERDSLREVVDALRDFLRERDRILQAYAEGNTPDDVLHLSDGASVHHDRMMRALEVLDAEPGS